MLSQLAEEGYMVVYPQRGTAVSMIEPERVKQAVHAHIVLEQAVLEELRGKYEEGQLKPLEDFLNDQRKHANGKDEVEYIISEHQIHYYLYCNDRCRPGNRNRCYRASYFNVSGCTEGDCNVLF